MYKFYLFFSTLTFIREILRKMHLSQKFFFFIADDEDHCQCPKSLIALPPLRLSEAVSNASSNSSSSLLKSSCWKCAGPSTSTASLTLCSLHANSESTENIDEIVQDHDNFGTDENEDDSSLGIYDF